MVTLARNGFKNLKSYLNILINALPQYHTILEKLAVQNITVQILCPGTRNKIIQSVSEKYILSSTRIAVTKLEAWGLDKNNEITIRLMILDINIIFLVGQKVQISW